MTGTVVGQASPPRLTPVGDDRLFEKLTLYGRAQPAGERIIEDFIERFSRTFEYHIFTDWRREPKSYQRCVEKILEYVERGQASSEVDAIDNWLKDLCGGRLIVVFPVDREIAVRRFRSYVEREGPVPRKDRRPFRLDGDEEVREYPSGYKAIHQVISIEISGRTWFPYEIQVMNAFQHVWDKVQGPLYREPKQFPGRLHSRLSSLSKRVDELSSQVNSILATIARYQRRR